MELLPVGPKLVTPSAPRTSARAPATLFPVADASFPTAQGAIRRIKRKAGGESAGRSRRRQRPSPRPPAAAAGSRRRVAERKLSPAEKIKEREAERELLWLQDHPDATREQLLDWRDARERAIHPPTATPAELDFRHSGWWARRQKIRRGLVAAGVPDSRLSRFDNCGADANVWVHEDTGELKVRACYCHDRWCQPCARARALLIADNVREKIEGEHFLHIVLTTKHNTLPLADQIDRLYKHFKNLRGRKLWKNAVDGGAAFLQCHVAESDGLWHVHLHILARGKWLDAFELSAEWLNITGESSNVDVSAVRNAEGAAREVCRYASKPVDGFTVTDPDALAEVVRGTQGRRLCFTFGKWRSYRLTAKRPPADAASWRPAGKLTWYITAAGNGNPFAARALQALQRLANPPTGPPHLFYELEISGGSGNVTSS
jgi:hypothetical protein